MTKSEGSSAAKPGAFETLLRRLVQVPRSELEAEERKYQQQRERLRKKGEAKAKRERKS